ncbi:hypothetical protein Plhal304r1_c013g0048791 [Plasmopara halstedii]
MDIVFGVDSIKEVLYGITKHNRSFATGFMSVANLAVNHLSKNMNTNRREGMWEPVVFKV